MKVAIYGHPQNPKVPASRHRHQADTIDALNILLHKLEEAGVDAMVHDPLAKHVGRKTKVKGAFSGHDDLVKGKVKYLFSIGGDGTFLETLTLVRDSGIPVLGINTGRLGFLSGISREQIEPAVDSLLKGNFSLDKRAVLEVDVKGGHFSECRYALNEVAVQKAESSSMLTIHASLSGKFLNSYWADGLIVATPTGSTAYSLSCGGPIVMPDSDNFVITPIAPHNLNIRPVIISSQESVTLEIEARSPNYLVSLDSRSESVPATVLLRVKKADFRFSTVKFRHDDFLSTLRNKLNWGVDKRN